MPSWEGTGLSQLSPVQLLMRMELGPELKYSLGEDGGRLKQGGREPCTPPLSCGQGEVQPPCLAKTLLCSGNPHILNLSITQVLMEP
jgi:hypothetical protein